MHILMDKEQRYLVSFSFFQKGKRNPLGHHAMIIVPWLSPVPVTMCDVGVPHPVLRFTSLSLQLP